MLILAGTVLNLLVGENGVINRASNARIIYVLGALKEEIEINNLTNYIDEKHTTIEQLLSEGKIARVVKENDEVYYMYYAIKPNSFEQIFPNLKSLKITGETSLDNLKGVGSCKKLTSIQFENVNVNSMKGIEDCINLTSFNVSGWLGSVYNLDGLEECSKLTTISIQRPVTNISQFVKNIKKLEKLSALTIQGNKLTEEDLNNLSNNISTLTLRGCNISDITKLGEMKDLKKLTLISNNITNIESLKDCKQITYLDLSSNQIQDISSLSNLTNLETLILENNQITSILSLSNNTKIRNLNLKNNSQFEGNRKNYNDEDLKKLDKIGEIIDRNGTINIDLDKLGLFTNYKKLDLSSQKLENIYFLEGLTELTELNLSSNPSLKIDDEKSKEILNSMTKLKTIKLYWNKLDISALNTMPWLTQVGVWGATVDLSDIEDIISNVSLRIDTAPFSTIINCDASKITKIKVITYTNGDIKNVPDLSKFTNLTELNIPHAQADNYNFIENLSKLESLNLSYGNLHNNMPSFRNLPRLKSLSLTNCYLSTTDLNSLNDLSNNTDIILDLRNNSIIDATMLLNFDSSTVIKLENNLNLLQDSKDKLKQKFGNNVSY